MTMTGMMKINKPPRNRASVIVPATTTAASIK